MKFQLLFEEKKTLLVERTRITKIILYKGKNKNYPSILKLYWK